MRQKIWVRTNKCTLAGIFHQIMNTILAIFSQMAFCVLFTHVNQLLARWHTACTIRVFRTLLENSMLTRLNVCRRWFLAASLALIAAPSLADPLPKR